MNIDLDCAMRISISLLLLPPLVIVWPRYLNCGYLFKLFSVFFYLFFLHPFHFLPSTLFYYFLIIVVVGSLILFSINRTSTPNPPHPPPPLSLSLSYHYPSRNASKRRGFTFNFFTSIESRSSNFLVTTSPPTSCLSSCATATRREGSC